MISFRHFCPRNSALSPFWASEHPNRFGAMDHVQKRSGAVNDVFDPNQTELLTRFRTVDRLRSGSLSWALRPLYRLYESRLARQIEGEPIPRHIGIILDGNRRHGERHGVLDPRAIYAMGAHKLDDVLDWCGELAVPAVTLWVFSTDIGLVHSNRSQAFLPRLRRRSGRLP